MEDYEFDILWNVRKGKWIANLQRGKYLINMKASGYKELNKYIDLDLSEKEFKLEVYPVAA